ncbi:MAG: hypothetical protein M3405_10015 [Acidobacteriota bacterium]|jgi:chromosome segregation ATPase|nr:hypothetical protein [Acidobacteriota bacterium]
METDIKSLLEKAKNEENSLSDKHEKLKREYEITSEELEKVRYTISFIKSNISSNAEKEEEEANQELENLINLFDDDATADDITFVGGSESLLHEIREPMHISTLVGYFEKIGKPTTSKRLATNLRTDTKKRFRNLGRNVWALREWSN